jgi:hypothetical protein
MSLDFPTLLTKAGDLYDVSPTFFNVSGGVVGSIFGAIVAATWFMRGYGLKGKIDILEERLVLAKEQQTVAQNLAETFKTELGNLREQTAKNAPFNDLQAATLHLDSTLRKLLTANNAVTSALTGEKTKPRGRLKEKLTELKQGLGQRWRNLVGTRGG